MDIAIENGKHDVNGSHTNPDQDQDGVWQGGELLFTGGTNWEILGRSQSNKKLSKEEQKRIQEREEMYPDLLQPHRIKNLLGVRIGLIAAGVSASHAIAVDFTGTTTYAWGRNEKCQLGLGDNIQRNMPVAVKSLNGHKVISASCGRHHSVVVTSEGISFAAGSNKCGQLGIGSVTSTQQKEEIVDKFKRCVNIEAAKKVSCGTEFTVWLCGDDGKVFAAGSPEYGQIGDGSDHAYNIKEASVKIVFEPQPKPKRVRKLADVNIVDICCGSNHTIAVDSEGRVYSWGFGGYGRLGHKVQQDEHEPRHIETLSGRLLANKDAKIGAGGVSSWCTVTEAGTLFAWGKMKQNSGENQMYPNFFEHLSGWKIRSLSCGMTTYAIAAEKSCITWGSAKNGQLGYGPDQKMSSANPEKVMALEDMHAEQVACGSFFTLFLVDPCDAKIENMPVWDCEEVDPFHQDVEKKGRGKSGVAKGNAKRKSAQPAQNQKSKKAKKAK